MRQHHRQLRRPHCHRQRRPAMMVVVTLLPMETMERVATSFRSGLVVTSVDSSGELPSCGIIWRKTVVRLWGAPSNTGSKVEALYRFYQRGRFHNRPTCCRGARAPCVRPGLFDTTRLIKITNIHIKYLVLYSSTNILMKF
jgi:hypothetical protein